MSGKIRDLPQLPAFVDEIIALLGEGGTPSVVTTGEYPSMAIAFGGQHIVLVRDHKWSVTISLPSKGSWSLQTREEWLEAAPSLKHAVVAYRSQHPNAISMAAVIIATTPVLERRSGAPWLPSFPGTPVPSEAWLRLGEQSVGLFQQDASVVVVVWVEGDMRSMTIATDYELVRIGPWIEQQVDDQKASVKAATRVAPPPTPPKLEEVLAALRTGKRFQLGGGRYYVTYFMSGNRLRREIFDEGHTDVEDVSEAALHAAIQSHPTDFC